MDREAAVKATRHGAYAALVSAGITTIGISIAMSSGETEGFIGYLNDPWLIFDIVLLLFLAWFVYRQSRVAAALVFILAILGQIVARLETGHMGGILISVAFIYFYGRAVYGAFVYHKINKEEFPEQYQKKRKRWWVWLIVAPIGLIFAVLIGLGTLITMGYMPEVEVEKGSELSAYNYNKLKKAGLVKSRSDIEYYYSPGVFSVLEEGYIINETALKYYWRTEEDGFEITYMSLSEITSLEQMSTGGPLEDALYSISTDDESLYLYLPIDGDKHVPFIQMLRDGVTAHDDTATETNVEEEE